MTASSVSLCFSCFPAWLSSEWWGSSAGIPGCRSGPWSGPSSPQLTGNAPPTASTTGTSNRGRPSAAAIRDAAWIIQICHSVHRSLKKVCPVSHLWAAVVHSFPASQWWCCPFQDDAWSTIAAVNWCRIWLHWFWLLSCSLSSPFRIHQRSISLSCPGATETAIETDSPWTTFCCARNAHEYLKHEKDCWVSWC